VSQNTTAFLSTLGINTFYRSDATNIGVNSLLPAIHLCWLLQQNGDPGDDPNALAISNLGYCRFALLHGITWQSGYNNMTVP